MATRITSHVACIVFTYGKWLHKFGLIESGRRESCLDGAEIYMPPDEVATAADFYYKCFLTAIK